MREDLYDRSMSVGSFYHIYNRGVAKQAIFCDETDYRAFLESLSFYLDDSQIARLSAARALKSFTLADTTPPKQPLAIIHAYLPDAKSLPLTHGRDHTRWY
jgi:hypothetical protein